MMEDDHHSVAETVRGGSLLISMTDLPTQKTLPALMPANEIERVAALHRYRILDTPPEAAFDRITRLAARLLGLPIALISLVDKSRAWFKSSIGFDADEVARNEAICSFAVLTDELLVIPDTQLDDRFSCNPLVQSNSGVRFYAGAPLINYEGFNLGTLCLLDDQPHEPFTEEQQAILTDLAAMVVDELELRLATRKIAQIDAALLEVTQGVATKTGEAFLDALVRHFAKVLDVDYVYIGLVEGDQPKRLRTIATYAHGKIVENIDYLLQDTPCWEVLEQRQICCYPYEVQKKFPHAPLLKPLKVESYVAAPFFNSTGTAIGVLGIMDGQPLEQVHLAESLLRMFADRIATELERQRSQQQQEQFSEALRESEARYRLLAEAIPQFVWITDAEGQNEYVNQRFCQYTGLTFEEMQGLGWLAIIHPDDLERTRNCWLSAVSRGEFYEIEYRFRRADGVYCWFLGQGIPLKNEQGQISEWFGTCTDIESQKQVEQARLQLIEQEQAARESAEHANRIKDEFLAVLSHELRTPMNPILGWSKLLRSGRLNPTKTAQAIETIDRNAQLQVQLIDDLLDVSRILRGKMSLEVVSVGSFRLHWERFGLPQKRSRLRFSQSFRPLRSSLMEMLDDCSKLFGICCRMR
jgi:PAS domain S-box-containing protein